MGLRRRIPKLTETEILTECKRRCALCFGIDGHLGIKKGQIAHIDGNRSNSQKNNLVFLCLEHHNDYDTKTSQAKGFTPAEVVTYRDKLIAKIKHTRSTKPRSSIEAATVKANHAHDKRLFRQVDALLPEPWLRSFLTHVTSDHSYQLSEGRHLDTFCRFARETGNQFLCRTLVERTSSLVEELAKLNFFLAQTFFVFPESQHTDDWRLCMHPEMNIERGRPTKAESAQYTKYQKQLNKLVRAVLEAYESYRTSIKNELHL